MSASETDATRREPHGSLRRARRLEESLDGRDGETCQPMQSIPSARDGAPRSRDDPDERHSTRELVNPRQTHATEWRAVMGAGPEPGRDTNSVRR